MSEHPIPPPPPGAATAARGGDGTDRTPALPERPGRSQSGIPYLLLFVLVVPTASIGLFVTGNALLITLGVVLLVVDLALLSGFYSLQPNQAAVLTLFGAYRGTDRTNGLRWTNPFYAETKISERVRNFTTETSKVNDANGNPILIAANVVWRVVDTSRAVFGVDDFEHYVRVQSESAIRQLARSYPYDSFDEGEDTTTLIGDTGDVNVDLLTELQERAEEAGVTVLEARITDLSYAPEIAEAMLRRQQAAAIVAARAKIVEGAVLMVRDAIEQLQAHDGHDGTAIDFDPLMRASFAANLMTVIASDQPTSPIVNVGGRGASS